ncbi:MAG TPA: GTP cyclohydrolase I FolE [Thermoanaerobaculia bacterium]|nr:GTP cyclohydrolase I FolE [Thermoanaerobaculia bacterium]HUM31122.1 GTP cyclohydrolase I FolE [Thermoanaerobaculia bacterium]HXK69479.1 GTP cyclohydrolase I FolE [Thermoanaerobaculia bacterium]
MESLIREMLSQLGEDPEREGLRDTPARVAKSLKFLTRGYDQDPEEIITKAIFREEARDMIIVRDIEFFSMCEHHMLPFFGKCHVGYIPAGQIVGLSKIARLVDIFSRRFQVQERLTRQIAVFLEKHLTPKGVGVVMEARHLCMQMRGVEKQHSEAVTSCMLGSFREQLSTREEFLNLIAVGRHQ